MPERTGASGVRMALLSDPPPLPLDASLFLDLDGTLADFVDPDQPILFDDTHRALLRDLAARLGGRLAIVSGRALDNLRSTIDVEGLEYAGSHGLERCRSDGGIEEVPPASSVDQLWQESRRLAESSGIIAERKPTGVALHFRTCPDEEPAVERYALDAAHRLGFQVQRGSMVLELRLPGPDKGDVVRTLMAEPLFGAGRPLFVGDDLTDEHGFAAADELGGYGVVVGHRSPTQARYRLQSVAAVHEWLRGNG